MKSEEPLFIIGMGRTGSKMLRTFINQNTDYYLITEIHLVNPIYRSFRKTVKKKIGKIRNSRDVEKLVNCFYNSSFYGQFWNEMRKKEDSQFLGKAQMISLINRTDKSIKEIFRVLLVQSALEQNKTKYGAKTPVYISKSKLLIKWYPNSKIIHLTRDPRAIASSYIKKKEFLEIASSIVKILKANSKALKFLILLYVIITYRLTGLVYNKLKDKGNYLLIRYEDLVLNRKETVKKINNFAKTNICLDTKLPEKTLRDSYTNIQDKVNSINDDGVEVAYRWKKFLSSKEKKFVWFFTKKVAKKFGYHQSS